LIHVGRRFVFHRFLLSIEFIEHLLPQFGVGWIVEGVVHLVRVVDQIEQLRPVIVAGILDQLRAVGADGERERREAVRVLVKVLVEKRLPQRLVLALQLTPCISAGMGTLALGILLASNSCDDIIRCGWKKATGSAGRV
jgi:hypothetical protein